MTQEDRAEAVRRYLNGESSPSIEADTGIPQSTIRRLASEAGGRNRDESSGWLGRQAPDAQTRRCRNVWCVNRFVPVNDHHFFCSAECRESKDQHAIEDILREEGSLAPTAEPNEIAKRAFGQKNKVLRQLSQAVSLRDYLRYEVSEFYTENPEYRWAPAAVPAVPFGYLPHGEREVLVQLSDWQVGKLESGIGVDAMREQRIPRIKSAVRAIVERQRDAGYSVNRVVLAWGGDMLEGCYIYAGQNVTGLDKSGNTHRITTQLRVVAHMMAEVAYDVASYVQVVSNEVVGGNHGRPNGKNDFADPEDNFDLMCGFWASDITANEPRIAWRMHDDWWGGFQVAGKYIVSFHGDQWRGPLAKLEDLLPKWLANGVFGERPDVVLTHHRHDLAILRVAGIPVIQGGTIDGGSKWYLKAYGKASPPVQNIVVFSAKHTVESVWPIYF